MFLLNLISISARYFQKNVAEEPSPNDRPSHVLNDSEGHLIYKSGDILDERCKSPLIILFSFPLGYRCDGNQ